MVNKKPTQLLPHISTSTGLLLGAGGLLGARSLVGPLRNRSTTKALEKAIEALHTDLTPIKDVVIPEHTSIIRTKGDLAKYRIKTKIQRLGRETVMDPNPYLLQQTKSMIGEDAENAMAITWADPDTGKLVHDAAIVFAKKFGDKGGKILAHETGHVIQFQDPKFMNSLDLKGNADLIHLILRPKYHPQYRLEANAWDRVGIGKKDKVRKAALATYFQGAARMRDNYLIKPALGLGALSSGAIGIHQKLKKERATSGK